MQGVTEQLLSAVEIMFLGMVLVFLFLSVLIIAVKLVAKLCAAQPALESVVAKSCMPKAQSSVEALDPKLVAAITLAVQQYRTQVE